ETVTTRYFHTDHLGSIAVITNESGAVVERLSYDAWGKRRFPNGNDDPTGSIVSQITHGFTGEEHLSVGLVHLNGRVYDPLIGRMISADPFVPGALNGQAWNRYSYVGNDPLAFTDPSGYSWLSKAFHSFARFLQKNPIVRAIVQIAATVVLTAVLGPAGPLAAAGLALGQTALLVTAAAGGAAIATGLAGGKIGDVLKSAAIAGATAFAFNMVGDATGMMAGKVQNGIPVHGLSLADVADHPDAFAFNVAAHAAVGCGAAVASGGKCGPGALSAAAGAAVGPILPTNNLVARVAITAPGGGLASGAGGGRFADGAVTAALGEMFNGLADRLLRGPGHHMITNQIARKYDWSDAALQVFDAPYWEGGGRIPVEGHNFGDGHPQYNRNLDDFVDNHLTKNQIDPSKMTTEQAKDLVRAVNGEPSLRSFNARVYTRSMWQGIRNYYRSFRDSD